MIGALKGTLFKITSDSIWLNVNHVYYEVTCTLSTLSDLSQKYQLGNTEVFLYTYLHVREDAHVLFGFGSWEERELFLNLIKVNGIGPKSAIHILSGAPVPEIIRWIEMGDTRALAQLPKLGKKSAEQLVLSLRGRLTGVTPEVTPPQSLPAYQQVRSALINLGFKEDAVTRVMQQIPSDLDVSESIRWALKELSSW